jgi:CRISPR/Cas system-associated exonuclease Cas4 (RecB family)
MIKDLILNSRDAIEASKDWGFERNNYLNASEADTCLRQLWYAKCSNETPAVQDWGFARRGHSVEQYVVDTLQAAANVEVKYVGNDQISVQDKSRRLSATPDGIIKIGDGPWQGLEIKSIDPRTNTGRLPRSGHITQLRIAMALLTDYELKSGWLIYVDASNYNRIFEFEIKADSSVLDSYANRADRLFSVQSAETLDREGKRTGGCKFCPYTVACGVEGASVRQPTARSNSFVHAATRYAEIMDIEDQLKEEKAGLKEDLLAGVGPAGKAIVNDIEVSVSMAKGRASLDRKAVAAAGIDLSRFEKTGAPTERLNVKRI